MISEKKKTGRLDIFTKSNFENLLTLRLFLYVSVGKQDSSFYLNRTRVFLTQEIHSLTAHRNTAAGDGAGMRGEGVWNQTPFQVEQMVFSVVTADEDRGARQLRSAAALRTRSSTLPWVLRATRRPSNVSARRCGR